MFGGNILVCAIARELKTPNLNRVFRGDLLNVHYSLIPRMSLLFWYRYMVSVSISNTSRIQYIILMHGHLKSDSTTYSGL